MSIPDGDKLPQRAVTDQPYPHVVTEMESMGIDWDSDSDTLTVENIVVSGDSTIEGYASGSWTPTITGSGGFTSATLRSARYQRQGSIVTCTASMEVSASDTDFAVELTPPIASNFANAYDVVGAGGILNDVTPCVSVSANSTSNNIALICNPLSTPDDIWIICQYTII